MQDSSNNFNSLNNEIELSVLIRKLIRVIYRERKFLISSVFLCLTIGLTYYVFATKEYKSRMIISSNLLRGPSLIIVLDDLERHIDEKNYLEVARYLNLEEKTAKKIKKIEIFSARHFSEVEFSEKIEGKDEDEESKGEYIIEASLTDNSLWPTLQKGLLFYLANNEFSRLKSFEKKEGLKQYRNRIHNELIELENLKKSLSNLYTYKTEKASSSIYISDPSSIYNNILNLYQAEVKTSVEIGSPDIAIVQAFVPFKKHTSPKLLITAILSVFFGIFVFFLVLLFKEVKDKVIIED